MAYIMEQLNQISVRGEDVECMYAAKQTIRKIQAALAEAKKNETKTE